MAVNLSLIHYLSLAYPLLNGGRWYRPAKRQYKATLRCEYDTVSIWVRYDVDIGIIWVRYGYGVGTMWLA